MRKEELVEKIEKKQNMLFQAEQESNAWNNGKYKNSSKAKVSKIYVQSLRDEIDQLNDELKALEVDKSN